VRLSVDAVAFVLSGRADLCVARPPVGPAGSWNLAGAAAARRPDQRSPAARARSRWPQARSLERFPDGNPTELVLVPSDEQGANGSQAMARHRIGRTHRDWLDALPSPPRRPDGTTYDLTTITPYSYRHTYAQRHADAGVALDVLAELMGHELLRRGDQHLLGRPPCRGGSQLPLPPPGLACGGAG